MPKTLVAVSPTPTFSCTVSATGMPPRLLSVATAEAAGAYCAV
ncbi:MAG: hypothetical protein WA112_06485 [Rugosibacter sp.]